MSENEHWMRVYYATLDTNIFIRSIIRMENLANKLISLWYNEKYNLVLPQAAVNEIQNVLTRRDLIRKYQYPHRRVINLIHRLNQDAQIVDIPSSFGFCRDPKDNPLVDCAIQEKVQFLVSYDKDIVDDPELKRRLFEYGVEIVEPSVFLDILKEAKINTTHPTLT